MPSEARRICLIDAHPDPADGHLCTALADAYAAGATASGHSVARVRLATLDLPLLRDPADFARPPPEPIRAVQAEVAACRHLVVVYPLWLGTMPALMKAFFEQLARAEFLIAPGGTLGWPRKMLAGRSARVVVTMGMPAAAYRLLFGAHGEKGFESAVLGLAGFRPVRATMLGGVGGASPARRARWLDRMRALGARGR
jgi:putative NADPH-quinone reductase